MPQQPAHDPGATALAPITTVCEFPINTFVENIAVRASGHLLLTVHNTNQLFLLDPSLPAPQPVLLHTFAQGVSGIAELGDDRFYVSSGTIGQAGSWGVHCVDMAGYGEGKSPAVRKVVDVPQALFLNGSAALPGQEEAILVVDSLLGAIFRVVPAEGACELWLRHERFAKLTDSETPAINGVKVHGGRVLCSNTDARTFLGFEVDGAGKPSGEVRTLYDELNVDDFAVGLDGAIYMTTHIFQSVMKIDKDGVRTTIAGGADSTLVAGSTAAAFGRGPGDQKSLYVTTNGGMSLPVDGIVGPARVLRITVGEEL